MFFQRTPKSEEKSGPLGARKLLKLLAEGQLPCRVCGEVSPVDAQATPLTFVTCSCGNAGMVVPRRLGSCWLFEFVDQGGMGVVYRAVSADYPGETFAVKLIAQKRVGDGVTEDALINEAMILQKFEGYPHIAQAVEVGEDAGDLFLVSEFIDGDRLDARIERAGPMDPATALALVRELTRVDKFIWQRGYLYRDLKPENVLLPDGKCKLIDFGLCASLNDASYVDDPEINGAPHFMPPERLAGEPEGVFSETYSLGMILYYCLTGQTLFPPGDAQTVAEQYLSGDRSTFVLGGLTEVPWRLVEVVEKAISLQIPGRYQSFDRFDSDLQACERATRID